MSRAAAEPRRSKAAPADGKAVPSRSGAQGAWDQISTLVFAVMIALAVRAFVIEPFRIPSGSMFPTLLIGDHLFVNKFVYGIKIPFTELRLPGFRAPERGDVIVFTVAKDGARTHPADEHPDLPREEFVKRIIGLPGDRIEIHDGVVSVNGEVIPSRRLEETFVDDYGHRLAIEEVQIGEDRFRTLDDKDARFPDARPITVPEGRYFMLGDNRDHSKDSRVWGTVRLAEIKGPALILYWSWDFNGGWLDLLDPRTLWSLFTQKMRWGRIGDVVH